MTITTSSLFCNNLQLQCKLVVPLCILTSLLQLLTTGWKSSQHLYTIRFDFLIGLVKMNVELNLVIQGKEQKKKAEKNKQRRLKYRGRAYFINQMHVNRRTFKTILSKILWIASNEMSIQAGEFLITYFSSHESYTDFPTNPSYCVLK